MPRYGTKAQIGANLRRRIAPVTYTRRIVAAKTIVVVRIVRSFSILVPLFCDFRGKCRKIYFFDPSLKKDIYCANFGNFSFLKILFPVYFRNMKFALLGLLAFCIFISCSNKPPQPYPSYNENNGKPTLIVWGFTCEIGGKKCTDRQVGRQMRDLVIAEMSRTGKFREAAVDFKEKKHMQDVSDMLWSSNEPDVLYDLVDQGNSDYLVIGRVLEYEKTTRFLRIELSLIRRATGQKVAVQGKGASGSLEKAVHDAALRLHSEMPRIMD